MHILKSYQPNGPSGHGGNLPRYDQENERDNFPPGNCSRDYAPELFCFPDKAKRNYDWFNVSCPNYWVVSSSGTIYLLLNQNVKMSSQRPERHVNRELLLFYIMSRQNHNKTNQATRVQLSVHTNPLLYALYCKVIIAIRTTWLIDLKHTRLWQPPKENSWQKTTVA